ncbi:serine hydrolase domain-containing protein [Asticcacaulis solisilvae]|uniref:serine hydrolase domain-containing protein n=1 Tax=Asticcacaulis solisilvae TaxID=1217274 RepID=UPI003FD73022
MRPSPLLALTASTLLLAGCGSLSPIRAARVATGFTSHQLCSSVFISGLDGPTTFDTVIGPTFGPAKDIVHYRIDRDAGTVTARLGGMVQTAVYRGPEGCLLLEGAPPAPPMAATAPDRAARTLPAIAQGPEVVVPESPALKAALDHAFEEPASGGRRNTLAVVVVHDGRIVAERYAPGVTPDTPLIGWSMSKSVTNALLGILVRQGRLDMQAPGLVAEWGANDDPRRAITPDHLLRMTSGTRFGQSLTADPFSAFDPTAQMVFGARDMAGMAATAPYEARPGAVWRYSNGNTLLLSRMIRDRTGGTAAGVAAFARHELFDPLGMDHVVIEFDATGTPIGSSHAFAPARDWARFGLLFANDGMAGDRRILPEGWTGYSARPTPGSEDFGYGAGFWTNRGDKGAAAHRVAAGMPADSFMARGSYGQAIVIAPKERLVIVRLGNAFTPMGDIEALERLVRESRSALGE